MSNVLNMYFSFLRSWEEWGDHGQGVAVGHIWATVAALTSFASCYLSSVHGFASRYERFVGALEDASRDMLRILKDKALKVSVVISKLLNQVYHCCSLSSFLNLPQCNGVTLKF